MRTKVRPIIVVVAALLLSAGAVQADVFDMGGTRDPITGVWTGTGMASLEFVTVGDPCNAADNARPLGSVPYTYQMGKYDVTSAQYTEFLNAVATQSDPYGLYNANMLHWGDGACGITKIATVTGGTPGNYTYKYTYSYITTQFGQVANHGNLPVDYVSWGDSARFCNWLANGQPTGIEGAGTTETGSYALNGAITDADLMAVTRNFSAKYVIPTLNEWYKAAYYKGGSTDAGYWLYPTQSNATPSYVLSSSGTNNANYGTGYPTWVGAYVSSPGPYGTYDMGGDVYQWTDQLGQKQDGTVMGFILEGGSCDAGSVGLQSGYAAGGYPTCEYFYYGFRVAEVPEPVTMAILALGGFGMLTRRRGR